MRYCVRLVQWYSITTNSTADVTVYLSLRDGDSSSGPAAIARDLHPASHKVSTRLLRSKRCTEHASVLRSLLVRREAEREAHAEAAREGTNRMCVRRGEGAVQGVAHDREGQGV